MGDWLTLPNLTIIGGMVGTALTFALAFSNRALKQINVWRDSQQRRKKSTEDFRISDKDLQLQSARRTIKFLRTENATLIERNAEHTVWDYSSYDEIIRLGTRDWPTPPAMHGKINTKDGQNNDA